MTPEFTLLVSQYIQAIISSPQFPERTPHTVRWPSDRLKGLIGVRKHALYPIWTFPGNPYEALIRFRDLLKLGKVSTVCYRRDILDLLVWMPAIGDQELRYNQVQDVETWFPREHGAPFKLLLNQIYADTWSRYFHCPTQRGPVAVGEHCPMFMGSYANRDFKSAPIWEYTQSIGFNTPIMLASFYNLPLDDVRVTKVAPDGETYDGRRVVIAATDGSPFFAYMFGRADIPFSDKGTFGVTDTILYAPMRVQGHMHIDPESGGVYVQKTQEWNVLPGFFLSIHSGPFKGQSSFAADYPALSAWYTNLTGKPFMREQDIPSFLRKCERTGEPVKTTRYGHIFLSVSD